MNSKSSTIFRFSETCWFFFQNVIDLLGHTVTQTGFHFLFRPFVFWRLCGLSITRIFYKVGRDHTKHFTGWGYSHEKCEWNWEKKVFHVFELFKRLKLSGEPETKTDISSECAIPRLIESPHISACGSDMWYFIVKQDFLLIFCWFLW